MELTPLSGISPLRLSARIALWVALDIATSTPDGRKLATTARQSELELYFGYTFRQAYFEGLAGFGFDTFTLDGTQDIPNTNYLYGRLGARGGFQHGPFEARLKLPYRPVFSAGEIAGPGWFPRARTAGLDFRLVLEFMLADHFGLMASGGLVRYFGGFDPRPNDVPLADGFVDQRWRSGLGVSYRM